MSYQALRQQFLEQYDRFTQQFVEAYGELQASLDERERLNNEIVAASMDLSKHPIYDDPAENDRVFDEYRREQDKREALYAELVQRSDMWSAKAEQINQEREAFASSYITEVIELVLAPVHAEMMNDVSEINSRYGLLPSSDEILH